jgi:hypothetical protein
MKTEDSEAIVIALTEIDAGNFEASPNLIWVTAQRIMNSYR